MQQLYCLCILIALTVGGNAFQCYVKNNATDTAGFVNATKECAAGTKFCAQYVGSTFGKTTINVKGCDPLTYTSGDEEVTISCSGVGAGKSQAVDKTFASIAKLEIFCCDGELCNAASSKESQLAVLLALISAVLYFNR